MDIRCFCSIGLGVKREETRSIEGKITQSDQSNADEKESTWDETRDK
jgi:hypothetical protein